MISSDLIINNVKAELNKDFQPLANNFSAEMRFSEVVFAGYGIVDSDKRDDYTGLKVNGKLVMILDGIPADYKTTQTGFSSPLTVINTILRRGPFPAFFASAKACANSKTPVVPLPSSSAP